MRVLRLGLVFAAAVPAAQPLAEVQPAVGPLARLFQRGAEWRGHYWNDEDNQNERDHRT